MLRRPVFALLFAPALMGAGACEQPFEEICTPLPEPAALTRFALLTDTLVVTDTSVWVLDTLWAEIEPVEAWDSLFGFELVALTPAGDDYVFLRGTGPAGTFLLTRVHRSSPLLTQGVTYRVPAPGLYAIHGAWLSWGYEECTSGGGGSFPKTMYRDVSADSLAALGMDRRTFVVIHRLGGDSTPPPVTRQAES